MLTPWDEFLCHQLPTTMDHVFTSDPAWTERVYISLYNVADKDMILGCGVGQYPNKNVQDGFATVWYQGKQYNFRASRRLGGRVVAQAHTAQSPRVAERDLAAVPEHEKQLEKAGRPLTLTRPAAFHHEAAAAAAADLDPAGHPEVKARPGPAVELEPEVLAVAAGRDHPTTQQSPPHARRAHALEHDGIAHAADGDDSPPDRGAGEQAAGGFDLRKLGHRAVVYDEIPAKGAEAADRRNVLPCDPNPNQ